MKPSIPKGTRDFLPKQVNRRNYIFETIRSVFVKYGYQAIETPAMESLSTLTGKYGEEGDRLLFKVLNNGDFMDRIDPELKLFNDNDNDISLISYFNQIRKKTLIEILKKPVLKKNDHFIWSEVKKYTKLIIDDYFDNLSEEKNEDINLKSLRLYFENNTEKLIDNLHSIKKEVNKKLIDISAQEIEESVFLKENSLAKKFQYFHRVELPRIKSTLRSSKQLIPSISKRGLRYDLTIPFARFVVMYQNDIHFPFKRYQMQPVWRADRPQKGRYQEFYQCDVDVVGSQSLSYETELIQIYDEVFGKLGIKTIIRINNRKILQGIAEYCGCSDNFTEITVAIDKLDKIGLNGVKRELIEKGFSLNGVERIMECLLVNEEDFTDEICLECGFEPDSIDDYGRFEFIARKAFCLYHKFKHEDIQIGMEGIKEIFTVLDYLKHSGYSLNNKLQFDITLARGLNYYTGCIFEVNVDTEAHPNVKMGSIGGGGRYADLTSVFGMKNMPGVGVSFGAERVYDVLEELDLFPAEDAAALKVLLVAFDEESHRYAFRCLNQLRAANINADLYPDPVKLKKQMKYANDRNVPYVILIGDNEMASGELSLKNMGNGEQEKLSIAKIIDALK